MMKNISVRLSQELVKDAEELSKLSKADKSAVIREALERGLVEVKLKYALELFSEGKVSTSEAAAIAGLSVGEMMDELVRRGMRSSISGQDIKGSLERALKIVK